MQVYRLVNVLRDECEYCADKSFYYDSPFVQSERVSLDKNVTEKPVSGVARIASFANNMQ